jgi:uncharacterized protein YcbX
MFVKELWHYPVKSMSGERIARRTWGRSAYLEIARSLSVMAAEW